MNKASKLNLTRKWRSKTFDTIVGQDISIKILKNSLYLDQVFPVYLFSGKRGCGKTTTARVFTAALNCFDLEAFRKDPRSVKIPCLKCTSCLAMENGKHPDFTEIDAASHTGVDNVRQLIETTTFLPQMGVKKVYLIDEVHMLSKAAFNALLKVLEEPPKSVIFILATTDPHKVIDTVKSRCFQLFFGPPESSLLLKHLKFICNEEGIEAETEALQMLIRESDGLIRDAMNLLEQVRFIGQSVTVANVESALGYVSDSDLLNLLELTLAKSANLPKFLRELNLASKNIEFIWKRMCELVKMILYAKHGVAVDVDQTLQNMLHEIASKFALQEMIIFLEGLVRQEQILSKTAHKTLSLELFFLSGSSEVDHTAPKSGGFEKKDSDQKKNENVVVSKQSSWQRLLGLVSQCGDPILISIFKQAKFVSSSGEEVVVQFAGEHAFFEDLVFEKENVWLPTLQQVFGGDVKLKIQVAKFDAPPKDLLSNSSAKRVEPVVKSNNTTQQPSARYARHNRFAKKQIDVSDKQKWPIANQILEHFPGQVYEVNE